MNLHTLNFTREELRRALADNSGSSKGQLTAFSENPPADKDRCPRKKLHLVQLDNGKGGVRFVNAHNTALHVMVTRSRRQPFPPIRDDEFSYATWRRAVNTLEEHEQAWLRYCYGFDLNFQHQTLMCEFVWNNYINCRVEKKMQSRVVKKVLGLVWLAGQEVAAGYSNSTYREYAGAALSRMMSVDRSVWLRVYAGHWEKLKAAFNDLDNAALSKTYNRHTEMNDAKIAEM